MWCLDFARKRAKQVQSMKSAVEVISWELDAGEKGDSLEADSAYLETSAFPFGSFPSKSYLAP